nr:PREDICTED: phosphoribosylformylglycinamidine synthase-like [Lepisosteus oculatus]
MVVLHFYRKEAQRGRSLQRAIQLCPHAEILTESCYSVEWRGAEPPSAEQKSVLLWLFSPPLEPGLLREQPFLCAGEGERLLEIGPR